MDVSINRIKAYGFIDKIWGWVRVDGLLHLLSCYCITITVGVFNWWVGLISGVVIGVLKEIYDHFVKKSDPDNIHHDLICDAAGVILSEMILMLHIFI